MTDAIRFFVDKNDVEAQLLAERMKEIGVDFELYPTDHYTTLFMDGQCYLDIEAHSVARTLIDLRTTLKPTPDIVFYVNQYDDEAERLANRMVAVGVDFEQKSIMASPTMIRMYGVCYFSGLAHEAARNLIELQIILNETNP